MINKIFVLITVFLLLIIPSVLSDYSEVGTISSNFTVGTGIFNSQITTDSVTKTKTNTGTYPPLVTDLDGDGTSEIIHASGSSLRIYQGNQLTTVGTFTTSGDPAEGNMITFDIDNDGNSEIIVASNSVIEILEWNGTDINKERQKSVVALLPNYVSGEYMVKCVTTETCAIMGFDYNTNPSVGGGGDVRRFLVNQFGMDTNGTQVIPYTTGGGSYRMFCFPKIRTSALADYDDDGTEEIIVSYMDSDHFGSNQEQTRTIYLDVMTNGTVVTELSFANNDPTDFISGNSNCNTGNTGRYVSPPLVADFDTDTPGLETVIGYGYDDDEFKMNIYSSTGSFIDDYPEVGQADGKMISGVLIMDSFSSTDELDFCLLGFNEQIGSQQLDLLCGSTDTAWYEFDDKEYEYTLTESDHNISDTYGNYNIIAHSGNHDQTTGLDELVTSYGVFKLNEGFTNSLSYIYNHGKGDSVVISANMDSDNSLDDLLVMTSTNIYYIDDGFSNSGAVITEYSINPCLDSVWKYNNGTAEITIEVTDDNGALEVPDLVSARAILYEGDSNEQDSGWSANLTSGTTFTFPFVVNKTITGGVIKLYGRDTGNPEDIDTITKSFSVGTQGVEFGDCITTIEIGIEEATAEEDIVSTDTSDNSITNAFNEISTLTNLGGTLLYLIFMGLVALAVWVGANANNVHVGVGVIGIIETILLIIGVILGFIGVGYVIILVMIMLIWIANYFRGFITGNNGMQ